MTKRLFDLRPFLPDGDTDPQGGGTPPANDPPKSRKLEDLLGPLSDEDRAAVLTEVTKARNEAAGYRTKVRELEPLANKAKELEDASKSDVEKATENLAAAEKRAQEAELRAARAEVAAAKGLTPAQAKRLVGTTQEELEADADELLEVLGKPATAPVAGRPKENLRGGGDPTDDAGLEETDPAKLAASVPRANY